MYASHYRKAGMQLSLGTDVMISRSIEKSGRLIAAPRPWSVARITATLESSFR